MIKTIEKWNAKLKEVSANDPVKGRAIKAGLVMAFFVVPFNTMWVVKGFGEAVWMYFAAMLLLAAFALGLALLNVVFGPLGQYVFFGKCDWEWTEGYAGTLVTFMDHYERYQREKEKKLKKKFDKAFASQPVQIQQTVQIPQVTYPLNQPAQPIRVFQPEPVQDDWSKTKKEIQEPTSGPDWLK
jgi:hypothetical protein